MASSRLHSSLTPAVCKQQYLLIVCLLLVVLATPVVRAETKGPFSAEELGIATESTYTTQCSEKQCMITYLIPDSVSLVGTVIARVHDLYASSSLGPPSNFSVSATQDDDWRGNACYYTSEACLSNPCVTTWEIGASLTSRSANLMLDADMVESTDCWFATDKTRWAGKSGAYIDFIFSIDRGSKWVLPDSTITARYRIDFYLTCFDDNFYGHWTGPTCSECSPHYSAKSECKEYTTDYLLFAAPPTISYVFLFGIICAGTFIPTGVISAIWCYRWRRRNQQSKTPQDDGYEVAISNQKISSSKARSEARKTLAAISADDLDKRRRYFRHQWNVYLATAICLAFTFSFIAVVLHGLFPPKIGKISGIFKGYKPASNDSTLLDGSATEVSGSVILYTHCTSSTTCTISGNMTDFVLGDNGVQMNKPQLPFPEEMVQSLMVSLISSGGSTMNEYLAKNPFTIPEDFLQYVPGPMIKVGPGYLDIVSVNNTPMKQDRWVGIDFWKASVGVMVSQEAISQSPTIYLPYLDEWREDLLGTKASDQTFTGSGYTVYLKDITLMWVGPLSVPSSKITTCGVDMTITSSFTISVTVKATSIGIVIKDWTRYDIYGHFSCGVDICVGINGAGNIYATNKTNVVCTVLDYEIPGNICPSVLPTSICETPIRNKIAGVIRDEASNMQMDVVSKTIQNFSVPTTTQVMEGVYLSWYFNGAGSIQFGENSYVLAFPTVSISVDAVDTPRSQRLTYGPSTQVSLPMKYNLRQGNSTLYADLRVSAGLVNAFSWALGHRKFWNAAYEQNLWDARYYGAVRLNTPFFSASSSGVMTFSTDKVQLKALCARTGGNVDPGLNMTFDWFNPLYDKVDMWNKVAYNVVEGLALALIFVGMLTSLVLVKKRTISQPKLWFLIVCPIVIALILEIVASIFPAFAWLASDIIKVDVPADLENAKDTLSKVLGLVAGFLQSGFHSFDLAPLMLSIGPAVSFTGFILEYISHRKKDIGIAVNTEDLKERFQTFQFARLLRTIGYLFYPLITVLTVLPIYQLSLRVDSAAFWTIACFLWVLPIAVEGLNFIEYFKEKMYLPLISVAVYFIFVLILAGLVYPTLATFSSPVTLLARFLDGFFLLSSFILIALYPQRRREMSDFVDRVKEYLKEKFHSEGPSLSERIAAHIPGVIKKQWFSIATTIVGVICLLIGIILIQMGKPHNNGNYLLPGTLLTIGGAGLLILVVLMLLSEIPAVHKFWDWVFNSWIWHGGAFEGGPKGFTPRLILTRVFATTAAVTILVLAWWEWSDAHQDPLDKKITDLLDGQNVSILIPPGGIGALTPVFNAATSIGKYSAGAWIVSMGVMLPTAVLAFFPVQPLYNAALPFISGAAILFGPMFYVFPNYISLVELPFPSCGTVFNQAIQSIFGFAIGEGMATYFSLLLLPAIIALPPSIARVCYYLCSTDDTAGPAAAFLTRLAPLFSFAMTLVPSFLAFQLSGNVSYPFFYIAFWILPLLATLIEDRGFRYGVFVCSFCGPVFGLLLVSPLMQTVWEMMQHPSIYLSFIFDVCIMNIYLGDIFSIVLNHAKLSFDADMAVIEEAEMESTGHTHLTSSTNTVSSGGASGAGHHSSPSTHESTPESVQSQSFVLSPRSQSRGDSSSSPAASLSSFTSPAPPSPPLTKSSTVLPHSSASYQSVDSPSPLLSRSVTHVPPAKTAPSPPISLQRSVTILPPPHAAPLPPTPSTSVTRSVTHIPPPHAAPSPPTQPRNALPLPPRSGTQSVRLPPSRPPPVAEQFVTVDEEPEPMPEVEEPSLPDIPLPPYWETRTDPSTGIPYYVNTQTKQSQWERPE